MATYAIGDLQGCYQELQLLLDKIKFDQSVDRLWFVGDIVNRGPDSLGCIRFVKSLGKSAITVLGNHDLHLIAVAAGIKTPSSGDTFQDILNAPDRDELIAWLKSQPLIYQENEYLLVHAGILPDWTAEQAVLLGQEVEIFLQSEHCNQFLKHMHGNQPTAWSNTLIGYDRLRTIVNAMTRLRFCSSTGVMDFHHKGETTDAPPGYMSWFDVPDRKTTRNTIVFGHWSALGLKITPNIIALDTGCVWGRELTAIRLEDKQIYQVQSVESA